MNDDEAWRSWGMKNMPRVTARHAELQDALKESESQVTKPKLSRAAVVQAQLKALQAEAAHLARFPEDNFPNRTVLMLVKTFKRPIPARDDQGRFTWEKGETFDQEYTYVLLKAAGRWWMTGQNGHQINGADWDKVIEFTGDDELIDVRTGLSVMTDAETLADRIGEEAAAKVDEFLADPSIGVKLKRSDAKLRDEARAMIPRLSERPTRDET